MLGTKKVVLIPVCANSQLGVPVTSCLPGAKRLEKVSWGQGAGREDCLEVPFPAEEILSQRLFVLTRSNAGAFTASPQSQLLALNPCSLFRLILPINLAKIPWAGTIYFLNK